MKKQPVSCMVGAMAAASRRSTYESPLRAEQVDRTREKLLEAGVDLVAAGDGDDLTVRRVAAHAKISVPTAYRYFPNRDLLVEEVATWINSKVVGDTAPDTTGGFADWTRSVYAQFEVNNRFMRAQLHTQAGRTMRGKWKKKRNEVALDAVEKSLPRASPEVQRRLAAVIRSLVNLNTWVSLNDDWGMAGKEAGEVIAWAITTLIEEARKRPAGLDFQE